LFHVNPDEPTDDTATSAAASEVSPDAGSGSTDEHDDTGLDLARTLARSIAGAAKNAPRQKPRRSDKTGKFGPGQRRRTVPKASGAFPDERDPQTLDTTMGRLVADHGWSLDLKVQSVFGRWPEIVGAEVAQHCQPTSFVDGKLIVRTASTAWATQLRLLAPTLVRRLNEELGHGSVTLIEIEGPNVPSWKKGRYGSRDGRGPRDTYG
jgi:predicted nucleic acid-binding Zn ribbon protein